LLLRLKRIGLILRTVSHLKPVQVAYQFKYRLSKPKPLKSFQVEWRKSNKLSFFKLPPVYHVLEMTGQGYKFKFLNLEKVFYQRVDWDFQGYGKLWNYNLQYLDFLKQVVIPIHVKLILVQDIYEKLWEGKLALEPYPASLRIMNIIRFLSSLEFQNEKLQIENFLLAEINYLSRNLEYHLLANHLLENAFALLMGGYFFDQKEWINRAEKLIEKEIQEQILKDGAHFELSPMYHQIILFRVLEAIAYLPKENRLHQLLITKAEVMMSWLKAISFKDGSIPHFNDSTDGIAFATLQLLEIGKIYGISFEVDHHFKESGYRKFEKNEFELVADIHGISPSYQPGHAHADTFSFCLNYKGRPIIVDPGISTYNISPRRDWERSSEAHNTLVINGENSAEVWAGFRVGKRLQVNIIEEKNEFIHAVHYGYRSHNTYVHRKFDLTRDFIELTDFFEYKVNLQKAILHFHFHPNVELNQISASTFQIDKELELEMFGDFIAEIAEYNYCIGYNRLTEAKKIKVSFLGSSIKSVIKEIQ
jgi:hypothetical protein